MTASGPDQSGHPEQDPRAAGQPAPGAWPPGGPGRPEQAQPWPAAQPPSWQPAGHGDPSGPAPVGQPHAQPPYGQTPYGQPPHGQAHWQQPYGPPSHGSPYGPPPYGAPHGQPSYGAPHGQWAYGQPSYGPPPSYGPGHGPVAGPARPSGGFDVRRLRIADHAVAAATLLTLVFMVPNWDSDGFFYAYNGFDVSPMTFGFLLLLLATAWTVVAAGADLRPQVPRGVVTVSLTGLALLMTLIAWLRTFADGFSVPALLTLLAVTTAATFAVLGLLPELRDRPALTGQLGQAAAWAGRPGPGSAGAGAPSQTAGWQPPQTAGWQPPQQSPWSFPGAQGWTAAPPPDAGAAPPASGGATAWLPPDRDGGAPGGPQPHDRG